MIISYIAAIFSLSGIWYNIRKNPVCWFLFMCSDTLWLIYSIITKQWAMTITHIIFMCVNFYGFYTWSYKNHGEKNESKRTE